MKRLLLLVAATLSMTACLDSTAPTPSDPRTETFASSLGVDIANMQVTTNGTFYRDEIVGTGTALTNPTTLTVVNVDYTGYIPNGSSFGSGTGQNLTLGNLIPGFVDGIIGMNVGSTRLVVIPSDLGYGNATQKDGSGNVVIPANSTLVFRIKLNSITPGS